MSRPFRRIPSRVAIPTLAAMGALAAAPAPSGAQQIDESTLMQDLRTLAADSMEGRAVGTPGAEKARGYIVSRLESLSIQVDSQASQVQRGGEDRRGVNIFGVVRGTDPGLDPFVLSAHYDHLGIRDGVVFNGADDNASGTAALLSIGKALAEVPTRRGVILAFFDAEEGGLSGARAFVEAQGDGPDAVRDEVAMNINLDMVSRSDDELWVSGTHQNPSLRPLLEAVEPHAGVTLRFGHDTPEDTGSDNWVMASDHGPFHQAGVPFLYFGVEDHPDYHRATDDAAAVDAAWYDASVETILRVIRRLADDPEAVRTAVEARRGGGM